MSESTDGEELAYAEQNEYWRRQQSRITKLEAVAEAARRMRTETAEGYMQAQDDLDAALANIDKENS